MKKIVVFVSFFLISSALSAATDLRASLFATTDQARQEADAAQAEVLAPTQYAEAMKYYQRAEEKLERGREIDDIRSDLDRATQAFKAATDATRLAEVTFASTIMARNDAQSAQAARYAAQLWTEAEEQFEAAASRLEDGNVNRAKTAASEAEVLFRNAELSAIKANYLNGTRSLIARANQERTDRYAPLTLAKAERLLAQAEKELNENRYDTDLPRSLAMQANYEARHALYLAKVIRGVEDDNPTLEALLLEWEKPLTRVGSALDMSVEMDKGPEPPTTIIVGDVEKLVTNSEQLQQDVTQLQAQVSTLQEELGGTSKKVQEQERKRRQLAQVEAMFNSDEARVLREGNNVILRLVGLSFASGQALIEPQYFTLLKKVQLAIGVFPDSTLVVEGHTDSYGSDAVNFTLSKERADAVREYLIANMGLPAWSIEAIGYGETRPISSNETAEGRARNRRIDIVIQPAS